MKINNLSVHRRAIYWIIYANAIARDPRESASDTREGMSPGGVKYDASQRNDKHVTNVCCRVAHDRNQEQHWGQQAPWSHGDKAFQACADESGVLGNPDSQKRHQDDTQWRESSEYTHHVRQESG